MVIVVSVVVGIVALVGYMLLSTGMNLGPSNLKHRFIGAGNLIGRSQADIIKVVGQPNSVSTAGNGGTLLQWQRQSETSAYHIALLFDAQGRCAGVTHEQSSGC